MNLDDRQSDLAFGEPRVQARAARPDELQSVCEVLGRAFADDPVAAYLFPDPTTRAARYARFAAIAMEAFGDAALMTTEPGLRSGAIWQSPQSPALGPLRRTRLLFSILRLTGSGFGRAARLGELMGRHHLREPHWYLAVLGTDPSAQRAGLASAVLEPVLARCDRERLPAYLESSKASNIPFYNKHGFEVVDELRVPGGPSLWPMIRRVP